jgi:hypothetical protein
VVTRIAIVRSLCSRPNRPKLVIELSSFIFSFSFSFSVVVENLHICSLSNLYARDVPGLSRAHSFIERFSRQRRRKKKNKKKQSSTSAFVRKEQRQEEQQRERVFFGVVIREKDNNNERRLWHDERVVFIARGERFERFTPARAIGGDE